MNSDTPIETFPALAALPFVRHGFTRRVPGLDVQTDRECALARLDEHHTAARRELGVEEMPLIRAQQVHGSGLAIVNARTPSPVPHVDGLITAEPGVCLGIYVADCGAVFLIDPERRAIALLHSGRKGTELGIVSAAIERMHSELGCVPDRMIAQLGPCIRPPHYEVDFAGDVVRQCRAAGLQRVFDCGVCTASDPERYYSYRAERGQTGRMLALLALNS